MAKKGTNEERTKQIAKILRGNFKLSENTAAKIANKIATEGLNKAITATVSVLGIVTIAITAAIAVYKIW
jgi:hypothetical protein